MPKGFIYKLHELEKIYKFTNTIDGFSVAKYFSSELWNQKTSSTGLSLQILPVMRRYLDKVLNMDVYDW